MLKFSPANAKTRELYNVKELKPYLKGRKLYSFDLLAGHSCPSAKDCQSRVIDGKIFDGIRTKFRCYAASLEALFPKVYNLHKKNMGILEIAPYGIDSVYQELQKSLPKDIGIARWHTSGDFKLRNYFLGFLKLVENNPNILFYAYTKQLKFWISELDKINSLPNLILTASYGGWCDDLIEKHNLRYAKVVFSREEAKKLSLKIDKTDELAANPKLKFTNFALLIHGVQPKNTEAAKAWQKLKYEEGGYKR